MILHAQINKEGRLNATLPELFRGKKVVIVLSEEYDSNPFKTTSQLQNESKAEHDETTYLLSSRANEKQLDQARKEFETGQWTEVDDLDELRAYPKTGIGKPEALKHKLSGLWSRRIDHENRLIYSFNDEHVYIWQARFHYINVPYENTRDEAIVDLEHQVGA